MKKLLTLIIPVLLIVLLVGGVFAYLRLRGTPIISKNISQQVNFGIFYPSDDSLIKVSRHSVHYDTPNQRLVFDGSLNDGTDVSFSEQSEPSSFIDVPTAYTKMIQDLNQYDSFESLNGTVYLTQPPQLNGGQSAVMDAKGTLLFARAGHNLAKDQWQRLFNNLDIVKNP